MRSFNFDGNNCTKNKKIKLIQKIFIEQNKANDASSLGLRIIRVSNIPFFYF